MSAQRNNKEDPPVFSGFIQPKKNYFHMPNVWIDICAEIKNLAELKVVQYVLRHTWGYREYGIAKAISVDEFMHGRKHSDGSRMDKGTGLSNHSVIDGLRAAIEHGFLVCEIDTSDLARVKKSYALKMASAPGEESSPHETSAPGEESTASSEESSPSYEESSHPGEDSSHRSEKYTTRKTPKKDTEEKQGTYNASDENAQPAPDASSSESYVPDFTSKRQSKAASEVRREQDSVAPAGGYVKSAVQATSQATAPRQSARQAPTFSNAPLFASTKPARPTLTAEGKLVREWYQVIRSTRVRLTDDNINACNGLSEEDGISFEALKEAIEYWDEDKYVKDHEIAIDLQKLEDPKGAFTFAKAMLILRKRKKPASVTPKPEMTAIEKLRADQLRYTQRGIQA